MKAKNYSKMTLKELESASREFDAEFVATKPLSRAMRGKWKQSLRGRPRVGKGAASVLVSVEKGLLGKADAYAKRHKMSRSQLISDGIRAVIGLKRAA